MRHADRLAGLERVARSLLVEVQRLREDLERAEEPVPPSLLGPVAYWYRVRTAPQ